MTDDGKIVEIEDNSFCPPHHPIVSFGAGFAFAYGGALAGFLAGGFVPLFAKAKGFIAVQGSMISGTAIGGLITGTIASRMKYRHTKELALCPKTAFAGAVAGTIVASVTAVSQIDDTHVSVPLPKNTPEKFDKPGEHYAIERHLSSELTQRFNDSEALSTGIICTFPSHSHEESALPLTPLTDEPK